MEMHCLRIERQYPHGGVTVSYEMTLSLCPGYKSMSSIPDLSIMPPVTLTLQTIQNLLKRMVISPSYWFTLITTGELPSRIDGKIIEKTLPGGPSNHVR